MGIQHKHLLSAPERREELDTTWGGATVRRSMILRISLFSSSFMWTRGSYLPVKSFGSSMGSSFCIGEGYTIALQSITESCKTL